MRTGEPVDDYGDDYGLRLKLVLPSTVVVAVVVGRKERKSGEEWPDMSPPLQSIY